MDEAPRPKKQVRFKTPSATSDTDETPEVKLIQLSQPLTKTATYVYLNTYTSKQPQPTGSLMSGMNVDKINFLNIQNEKIVEVVFGQKVDGPGFTLGVVLLGTHKV